MILGLIESDEKELDIDDAVLALAPSSFGQRFFVMRLLTTRKCSVGGSLIVVRTFVFLLLVLEMIPLSSAVGQAPIAREKSQHREHVLVIAEAKGWQHDSIPDTMVAIYEMGNQSGLWDTELRTDSDLLTLHALPKNGESLEYFDAVVFASTSGEMTLRDDQRRDLLTFVRDMGRGFVGIHAALDTNFDRPEYGRMLGGSGLSQCSLPMRQHRFRGWGARYRADEIRDRPT